MQVDITLMLITGGKEYWPEVVGMKGSEARKIIKIERNDIPSLIVVYIKCGSGRTDDFRYDRVWLDVEMEVNNTYAEGKVCKTPHIG